MNLTPVDIATEVVLAQKIELGVEKLSFTKAYRRVLAEPLKADRDFPPFDRVTMDGIAIHWQSYENGQRKFKIATSQMAGEEQKSLADLNECIEVMTGASLPENADTVVRYEDINMKDGFAEIEIETVKQRQNIHQRAEDRKQGEVIVQAKTVINAPEMAIAASIGAAELLVKKLPRVAIITSGDELVGVEQTPAPHQIRTSNIYCIATMLRNYEIEADFLHIVDDLQETENVVKAAMQQYDVLILSGGVSKGKKDFIPVALENLGVQKLFHRIQQQPGKPFWFGRKENTLVFALPGNPVSSFLCARRYFIPWLRQNIGLEPLDYIEAKLAEDFESKSKLSYFLQVKLFQDKASMMAKPIIGHGSGDFANLVDTDGFMELPAFEKQVFRAGEIYKVWRF